MGLNYGRKNESPWTPEEVAQLRRFADEGLTATGIAFNLERTRAAIVKKAVAERLSLDTAKHQC